LSSDSTVVSPTADHFQSETRNAKNESDFGNRKGRPNSHEVLQIYSYRETAFQSEEPDLQAERRDRDISEGPKIISITRQKCPTGETSNGRSVYF
jgi:hypothetical protein